jgi:hypothetical protein
MHGHIHRHADHFPDRYIWAFPLCELAGALAVFVGLFWWPVGVAAAIG